MFRFELYERERERVLFLVVMGAEGGGGGTNFVLFG